MSQSSFREITTGALTRALVGLVMIVVPYQGTLGRWLGLGRAIGMFVAIWGLYDSFKAIFLLRDVGGYRPPQGRLTLLRGLWLVIASLIGAAIRTTLRDVGWL